MYAPGTTSDASSCPDRPPDGRLPLRSRASPDVAQTDLRTAASRCVPEHPRMYRPDTSDRKGRRGGDVLELAILGLLHQHPMHGYELRKQLAQLLGGLRSISYGSLYPALKRLHAAGYV